MHSRIHPATSMLYKDDDEIRQDGINIEELDDEKIDKAIKGEEEEEKDEETPGNSSEPNNIKKEGDKATASGQDTDDDNNIPFHKHPRFKELIEKTHTLSEDLEKANATIEELKSTKKVDEDEPIAGWFKELYGDSEEVKVAWKIYNTQSKKDREETKREVLAELENRNSLVAKEESKWNKWVNSEINRLQDEGEKFDVNKLKKVMVDYRPTTEDGQSLDFNKGLDLYKKLYSSEDDKDKNKIRKKIADTTTSSGKTTQDAPSFMTMKQLRHKSFSSLADESD